MSRTVTQLVTESNLAPEDFAAPLFLLLAVVCLFLGLSRKTRKPRPVVASVVAPRLKTAMDRFSAESMALGVYHFGRVLDCYSFGPVEGAYVLVLDGNDGEPVRTYVTQSMPVAEGVDLVGRTISYQMTEACTGFYRSDHTILDHPIVKDVVIVPVPGSVN